MCCAVRSQINMGPTTDIGPERAKGQLSLTLRVQPRSGSKISDATLSDLVCFLTQGFEQYDGACRVYSGVKVL